MEETTDAEASGPDTVELGGNIEISGFKDVDYASMIVVKKIIGNYVKRFSEQFNGFEHFKMTMKKVHETPGSEKYELKAEAVVDNKPTNAEITERNLFVAVDSVLKKIEASLS